MIASQSGDNSCVQSSSASASNCDSVSSTIVETEFVFIAKFGLNLRITCVALPEQVATFSEWLVPV